MKSLWKYTVVATGAAFLALSGAVLSQSISVPQVSIIHPSDLIQVIPFGQPTAQSQYAKPSQITSSSDFYTSIPPSSFTFTFTNTQTLAAFEPASTLAYGYVTLAPSPSHGAQECVYSKSAITTLYLSGSSGQTVNDAVTTLAANAQNCYIYTVGTSTWNRSK